jgi:glycogen debranching enzyme
MDVRVGPPTLTIHADEQFLVCAPDATIDAGEQQGYFCVDTRLVSTYRLTLAGAEPVLLNSAVVSAFSARHEFVNAELRTRHGTVEERALHLRVDRTLHHGLHEDLDLTSYSPEPVELDLELRIEGDYADLFDVRDGRVVRRGRIDSRWDPAQAALTHTYRNRDFERGLRIEARAQQQPPNYGNGRLSFRIRLEPKERWHACLLWKPLGVGEQGSRPIERCHALLEGDPELAGRRREWRRRATGIQTANAAVNAALEQAMDDLRALRMHRHDEGARRHVGEGIEEMVPVGGIPWFVALFGRDALVVSLQTLLLTPGFAIGTLQALAPLQGERHDDRHDLQPGKIEHELRQGELAHFGLIPQTPYYGTHDATTLYVWAAAETWRWTANRALVERLRPHVERALDWIDRSGDLDGDGLQEYVTRAGGWGYENQGWKDAGGAIVHADGSPADPPIALCELQGYVVAAKRGWADVLEQAFAERSTARRLRAEADRLADAIENRFWWDDEGTYSLGLDGRKRPIASVASNPGHLLWAGAIPRERAAAVARRLLADDLWSGWGVRTLSADHVAYNPSSYQRGSIWPHDNAIAANGCARYGLATEAGQIARGLFDAAERFQFGRLPEVFAGFDRDEAGFPAQYLGANVPQAWASGALIHLVHALLRLEPDAAAKRLAVTPCIPDWLGYVELVNLRVGDARVDLRIDGGRVAVQELRGDLDVVAHGAAASGEAA